MAAKKKKAPKKSEKRDKDSTLFAFLATFLSIIGFVIAIIAKRDNKYVMYYAKQSLVVFITAVIASILGAIIGFIPVIGGIIDALLNLLVFILWIFSWAYALSNKEKETPIVGQYAEKFNF